MTELGKTSFFTAAEFEAMGYATVVWPVSALRMANKAQVVDFHYNMGMIHRHTELPSALLDLTRDAFNAPRVFRPHVDMVLETGKKPWLSETLKFLLLRDALHIVERAAFFTIRNFVSASGTVSSVCKTPSPEIPILSSFN